MHVYTKEEEDKMVLEAFDDLQSPRRRQTSYGRTVYIAPSGCGKDMRRRDGARVDLDMCRPDARRG